MLNAIQTLIDAGMTADAVEVVIENLLTNGEENKGLILLAYLRQENAQYSPDDIEEVSDGCFEVGRAEYTVLTDADADKAAGEAIERDLWAFNATFLSYETDLPEEVFTALQEKCEDANDTFRKLVDATCGIDRIVNQAIACDGRGHFLSQYDGEENEFRTAGGWFYIYRNN